jgi:hypothetical protein
MSVKALLKASICLFALMGSQARAESASELASGAISGYVTIKAFASVCKFEIEKPIAGALDSNIAALASKFNVPGAAMDAMMKDSIKQLSGHDSETCVWGPDKFNAMVSEMAKAPLAAAAKAGIAQAQIPASKVPLAPVPADPPADAVRQKAQNGIGGYMAIVAISKLCDFTLDPAAVNTILGNINVLKPGSELTDKELDDILDRTVATFGKDKQKYCDPGQAAFVSGVAEMAKLAAAEAEGSGIRLKPVEAPQPAAAATPAGAAGPATNMITGSDVDAIVAMAARYGDATLTKDKNGNPYIKNRSNGAGWTISFYGCDKGADCKSIEFYHGFETDNKPTSARINEWNQKKRWSKAYLDQDGDPNISFDINLRYGVARGNLEADIGRWVETIGDFKAFVGGKN